MTTHKDQHFVPRSYLAAWCDPACPPEMEPYVWLYPKESRVGRRKAPHNIFTESDMYTVTGLDGGRELGMEHLLSDIEGEFVRIRDNFILKGLPLDPLDDAKLRTLMVLMQSRTVRQRDHWQKQFGELREMGERMKESVLAMPPEERARLPRPMPASGPSLSMDDVKRLSENPVPMLLSTAFVQLVPQLLQMRLSILRADLTPGFITSDAPCVIFDPEAHKRPFPFNAPGLGFPTVQVTMPVAPSHLACLTHYEVLPPDPVLPAIVQELNRLTRGYANDHFVVSRQHTEEIWYDLGEPPAGSEPSTT